MRRKTLVLMLIVAFAVVLVIPASVYAYFALTTGDAPDRASLAPAEPSSGGPGAVDGTWVTAPVAGSFVGYRVRERLGPVTAPSDAVGRTREVDASFTIEGTQLTSAEVTVDMASLGSDSSHRDDIVRDRVLATDTFPTARFVLERPVAIGAATRGEVVDLELPGRLTLHGAARRIVFTLQARWDGPTIQTAGNTELRRADFDIDGGGLAGFSISDTATLEFELTLAPAGEAVDATPAPLTQASDTPTGEPAFAPCSTADPTPLAAPVVLTAGTEPPAVLVVSGSNRIGTPFTGTGFVNGATWSPAGDTIMFAASAGEQPTTLFVVPTTGGVPTALEGTGSASQPDWGPDGEIVFVKQDRGGDTSDIWIADAEGGRARVLVETPGVDADPRWSPDGRRVVFASTRAGTNQDVMTVRRDGRGLHALADSTAYEYGPSFAPDGRSVLFVRDGAIFRVAGDHEPARLTDGPHDAYPSLSPDGRQLVFIRDASLHVAAPDGTGTRCIVTNRLIYAGPRWRGATRAG